MGELEKNVLENINDLESKLSYIITRLYTYRNENIALLQRIENLESENQLLRDKRDITVDKLKIIMQKIEESEP